MALFARTARLALVRLPSPLPGGVGGGGQRVLNLVQYTVEISEHVVVPETKNAITGRFNLTLAPNIGSLLPIMLSAVECDDNLRLSAAEVHDEGANQSLPPKM